MPTIATRHRGFNSWPTGNVRDGDEERPGSSGNVRGKRGSGGKSRGCRRRVCRRSRRTALPTSRHPWWRAFHGPHDRQTDSGFTRHPRGFPRRERTCTRTTSGLAVPCPGRASPHAHDHITPPARGNDIPFNSSTVEGQFRDALADALGLHNRNAIGAVAKNARHPRRFPVRRQTWVDLEPLP